jgi:rhodanese-related sulfurtransferase
MIKQIPSEKIKEYLKANTNCILLDVRTKEEWNADGRPNGDKIGLKTHFITMQFSDGSFNEDFYNEFTKLNIKQDCEILTMCMGGVRSQMAAEILTQKNFKCSNVSDGFLGNNENLGWKKNNLPCD